MNKYLLQSICLLCCFSIHLVVNSKEPLYSLVDNKGQSVTANSYTGTTQFVFFGFANCPDVCPSALVTMEVAYSSLNEAAKSAIQPVFITVDPERDTVHAVDHYVEKHEGFVGLTGTSSAIKKTLQAFKVFAVKQIGRTKNDYDINHTSLIYVLSKNGQACESLSSEVPIADLSAKMLAYVENNGACKSAS